MRVFDIFLKKDMFYFPECIIYFKFRSEFDLYKEIFNKLGIKFKILDDYRCSGYELWEAGYDFDFRKLARKNLDIFNENKIKRIFSTEPGSYKTFIKDYPEILPDWDIEVINIWDLILEKLNKKKSLFIQKNKIVTYHDSCYLGRYCKVYEAPRNILKILGYDVKEMDNNKENSFCCGSCGGLARTNPELANKIARERITQAKRIGVNKMVVIGFDNYNILKNNSKNNDFQILELSHILADALNIRKLSNENKLIENIN
ncbi:MAG: (Fe-S)-binding protein [Nanoarchaeota archaeon]